MEPVEARERVVRAVERLLREDVELLRRDVNERSITHRLAVHLCAEFPGWNVDCEYNRDGHVPKTLQYAPTSAPTDDEYATTVFPDVIVHRRGGRENLVVIEAKKTTNPRGGDGDREKLRAFADQLDYKLTVFAMFETKPSRDSSVALEFSQGQALTLRA